MIDFVEAVFQSTKLNDVKVSGVVLNRCEANLIDKRMIAAHAEYKRLFEVL